MALDKVTTKVIADDAVTGAKIENNPTVAGNLTVAGTSTLTGNATASGTLTVAGKTTLSGDLVPSEPLYGRNMIVNGAMNVWQRGTSATAATGSGGSYGTVDRWKFCIAGSGAYTHTSQQLTAADLNTTGHRNALKLDVTTVSPTSAGNHAYFTTMLEGQDCQRPLYGTANAKDITLSFWVKSSKTGVYTVSLYSLAATNYQIPIEYTINSADTWEKKEILISPTAGSTSLITSSGGLIANNNAQAFTLFFGLHWEPSLEGTNNTWVTGGGAYGTSNQVNWLDSTSNTFYITGIQLEVGSSATPFEHRSYGDELERCQRYYFRWNAALYPYTPLCSGQGYNGSSANALMHFPTTMRTAPSFTFSSASHFWFSQGTGNPACSGMSQWGSGIHTSILIATVGNTAGYGGYLRAGNSTSAWAAWSAEF